MIAADTNVLVRLLTQDDATQYQRSLKLFQTEDTIFYIHNGSTRNGLGIAVFVRL